VGGGVGGLVGGGMGDGPSIKQHNLWASSCCGVLPVLSSSTVHFIWLRYSVHEFEHNTSVLSSTGVLSEVEIYSQIGPPSRRAGYRQVSFGEKENEKRRKM
jgi:hypothetical protein